MCVGCCCVVDVCGAVAVDGSVVGCVGGGGDGVAAGGAAGGGGGDVGGVGSVGGCACDVCCVVGDVCWGGGGGVCFFVSVFSAALFLVVCMRLAISKCSSLASMYVGHLL